jgi:YccS/YhfK family integral membrane protein
VLIPAFILYQYGLLAQMIALPLGALFISLTDNPGPINHRRNGMLVAILLGFVVLLIAGYSRGQSLLILVEIILFALMFSMIGVFGLRSNSIGITALIIFILNVDQPKAHDVISEGLYFLTGGIWYALLSLILYTLRPYRPIQQLLGECLMEIADYLQTKKSFYEQERNLSTIYQQLMQYQVRIHNHQDQLRQMLFSTRKFLSESTAKGRVLMMMFLDSIDLMERIMTSQQDYEQLHKEFDGTGIIDTYKLHINLLAQELRNIGLAVQSNSVYHSRLDVQASYEAASKAFFTLRDQELRAENVEGFIRLRHILYSLQDITERIRRLGKFTTYDKKLPKQVAADVELEKFIAPEKINFQLLISSFTLKSDIFRHAVRLVIALVAGYIVSLLFPLGHGYWILLTIAVILKPAYSITRKRNLQRLTGTFIGVALGFTVLFITNENGVLFIIMLASMVIGYSFLKLNYAVSSASITLFVLLNFHFLSPINVEHLLKDRIIDTAIGSVIAYLVSYFVLPAWEHQKIDEYLLEAIKSNRKYFKIVANTFIGLSSNVTQYKVARKDAFVALANLSDNFQRMLSEPKSQQRHMEEYHQFVAASHMLTSYIASLSYYAQRQSISIQLHGTDSMIRQADELFEKAIRLAAQAEDINIERSSAPVNEQVQQLLQQRRDELSGTVDTKSQTLRKELSELKTISEQYQLIYGNLEDQIAVLRKIKDVKSPSLQTVGLN